MSEERVRRLTALLREAGVGTGAAVAGANGDIAVVRGARPSSVEPLAERIRALGFRYVTVDLATLPHDASG